MILLFQQEDFAATSCIGSAACIDGFGQGSDNTEVVHGTIASGIIAFQARFLHKAAMSFMARSSRLFLLIGCLSQMSSVVEKQFRIPGHPVNL
jgi:hypothetical protein